jgi:hypothetical protein
MKITKSTLKQIIKEEQKLIMKERGAKPVQTMGVMFTYYFDGELRSFDNFNIDEIVKKGMYFSEPPTDQEKIDALAKHLVYCDWKGPEPYDKSKTMTHTNGHYIRGTVKGGEEYVYYWFKTYMLDQVPDLKDLTYDQQGYKFPIKKARIATLREAYKTGSDKYKGYCPHSITILGGQFNGRTNNLIGDVGKAPSNYKRVAAADKEQHDDLSWVPKTPEEIEAEKAAGKRSKFNDPYKKSGISEAKLKKIVEEELKNLK